MRNARYAVFCAVGALVACGGSSSETPFPQSSKEMPPDFRVTRPKTAGSHGDAPYPAIASSARPPLSPPPASSGLGE